MGGVSVIIRVRDERASLERCLGLLGAQAGVEEVEVIVVDSGSVDGSAQVARAAGAEVIEHALGSAAGFSYGAALNLGCARARHDILVSLSAHAFPRDDRWLSRLTRTVSGGDPAVACACGDRHGPDGAALEGPIAQDGALARRCPEWGYSNAAGAFRAGLWRRRPFREELPGCEDKEWALHWLAQGHRCVVDPALTVDHDHTHDSVRAVYTRARREARAYAMFLAGDAPGPATVTELARQWWSDTRWYDSAARARLSHRRAARLLGAYQGMSG